MDKPPRDRAALSIRPLRGIWLSNTNKKRKESARQIVIA
jgi:hypothetical protein